MWHEEDDETQRQYALTRIKQYAMDRTFTWDHPRFPLWNLSHILQGNITYDQKQHQWPATFMVVRDAEDHFLHALRKIPSTTYLTHGIAWIQEVKQRTCMDVIVAFTKDALPLNEAIYTVPFHIQCIPLKPAFQKWENTYTALQEVILHVLTAGRLSAADTRTLQLTLLYWSAQGHVCMTGAHWTLFEKTFGAEQALLNLPPTHQAVIQAWLVRFEPAAHLVKSLK